MMQENPENIILDKRDPTFDVGQMRRDPSDNPDRKPGPINIQKTIGGLAYMGIPTFFRLPVAIGGDHSIPNGTFRGIVDVYGKKQVAFVHFDAHLDRGFGKFGAFYHSGSYMTMAVAEGLLDGKAVFQIGMSAPTWGEKDWKQVKEEGATVYSLHEIRRDGVVATFDDLLKRLEPYDKIYISFDIDVFDMSYAPGVGSAVPTGMTPNELFPQIRRLAASKTIVGFDLVEYQPFYDNRGQQTARLCRRVMLQVLTGIAMKQKGLPGDWINPLVEGEP